MIEFQMSCGHFHTYDCWSTGKQLAIDRVYNRTQGLCPDCWKKLIEAHAKARADAAMRRKAAQTGKKGGAMGKKAGVTCIFFFEGGGEGDGEGVSPAGMED